MSVEENVTAQAELTSGQVLALWAQYEAGVLTLTEFHESAATVVEIGRFQGAAIGVLTVAAYVEVLSGIGVPLPGLRLPSFLPKILAALATITGEGPSLVTTVGGTQSASTPERVPMQLERLATAEVQSAAQDGMQNAIEDMPEVEGWTRELDSGACDFCRERKAEERGVMPKKARMARHPKCGCAPLPVIRTEVVVSTSKWVYRRGVGWLTREQAEVWDETGVVPDRSDFPRQYVPAGSLSDEEIAALPSPSRRKA